MGIPLKYVELWMLVRIKELRFMLASLPQKGTELLNLDFPSAAYSEMTLGVVRGFTVAHFTAV